MAAALAQTALCQAGSGSILPLREECGVYEVRRGGSAGAKGRAFLPPGVWLPRLGAHVVFSPQDLPAGGEQREGPLHQPQLLGDCGREARRLRALRGRAVRCAGWGVGRDSRALGPGPAALPVPDSSASSSGDGHRLIMRGAHLTAQEMLTAFASHIQARGAAGSGDKPSASTGR